MRELLKAPARGLARASTAAEARLQLEAARERLVRQIEGVQTSLTPLSRWKTTVIAAVKQRPLLTIGGAFLIGYALSRLCSRR